MSGYERARLVSVVCFVAMVISVVGYLWLSYRARVRHAQERVFAREQWLLDAKKPLTPDAGPPTKLGPGDFPPWYVRPPSDQPPK